MSSTFSTNLAIELIGTGDQAGVWGNTTNTNLGTLIEQAISGYVTQAVATGTDTTITIPNGATGVARNMYIELTGTGGTNTNLIVPSNKKLYFIFNNASGAVTVKVSGQTGVSVPAGKKVVLASNGTDTVNALNYIADFGSNSATITQLTATSATITNLTLTSLVISNLSIASANVTVLTSASATITNLLATSLTVSSGSTLNGGVVINEPGADVDFRVEGDTDANLVFVDASTDRVGVGTNTPLSKFQVAGQARISGGSAGTAALVIPAGDILGDVSTGQFEIRNDGNASSEMRVSSRGFATIYTGGSGLNTGTERLRVTSTGDVGIGTSSPATKLAVNGAVQILAGNALNFQNASASANGTISGSGGSGENTLSFNSGALLLNASGNLGLGVTPSAWGSGRPAIQFGSSAANYIVQGGAGSLNVGWNFYYDGSVNKYIRSDYASQYYQYQGQHVWMNAASGTAGNTITFTQAMVLDASGNLGVGTTSPSVNGIDIVKGSGVSTYVRTANGTYEVLSGFSTSLGGGLVGTISNHPLLLYANNAERARITSGGDFLVGSTSSSAVANKNVDVNGTGDAAFTVRVGGTTYAYLYATSSTALVGSPANIPLAFYTNATERARITAGGDFLVGKTGTDPTVGLGMFVQSNGALSLVRQVSTSANQTLLVYSLDAAAYRFYVGMDGTVNATNTTITAISDKRLKENIRDIDAGLDKIMALKPRTFDWKEGKGKDVKNDRGWIAQEFEQVFPDMISEWKDPAPEGEEPYKAVRADLIPILVKAMQEQQAMINELKAKVAALEA